MSDTATIASEDDGKNQGSNSDDQTPEKTPEEEVVSREELRKVIGQRDRWKTLGREKDAEIEALKAQLADSSKGKKADSDKANIDSYQRKLEAMETELTDARNLLFQATVEREAFEVAGKKNIVKPELFLKLYGDRFESYRDESGQVRARVRNSGLSIEDLADEFLEEYPMMAGNDLKSGAGAPKKGQNPNLSTSTQLPSGFDTWSQGEKTEWFKKHPGVKVSLF